MKYRQDGVVEGERSQQRRVFGLQQEGSGCSAARGSAYADHREAVFMKSVTEKALIESRALFRTFSTFMVFEICSFHRNVRPCHAHRAWKIINILHLLFSVWVAQVGGRARAALALWAVVLLPRFCLSAFTTLDVGMSHLCVSVGIQSFRVCTRQARSSSGR